VDARLKLLKEASVAASKEKQHDMHEELPCFLNDVRPVSDEEDANIFLWWKVSPVCLSSRHLNC
jgi:hypothetical protein